MKLRLNPLLGLATWSLAISQLLWCASVGSTEPEQTGGMLWLTNGDYLAGTFAQAQDESKIAWQHPDFVSAFEFDVAMVASVSFRMPPDAKPAQGDFGIELSGGDRLFGSVIGIDEQFVELRTARLGDIKVPRQRILKLFRWQDGESVMFADGDDAALWTAEGDKSQWQTRGGQLVSQHPDASLVNVSIPHQARIDLEVSWDEDPNFEIAFGVNPTSARTSAATAFRIEVWDDQIVALWALGGGEDGGADVGVIAKVAEMHGKMRLTIELDQISHHAIVWSEHGKLLAELQLKPRVPRTPQSGFWLQNIDGTVALEALQVVPGFTTEIEKDEIEKDVFYLQDGQTLKGVWTDVQADTWILTDQESEQRVDPKDVLKIRMASRNITDGSDAASSNPIQLTTFDGTRLHGSLEKKSDNSIEIRSEALVQNITIPTDSVRRLSVIGAVALPPATVGQGLARLESNDTRLHGRLVDSDPESRSAVLKFEPGGSRGISMLPTLSGRLVHREPRPQVIEPVASQRIQRVPQKGPAVIWGAFTRAFGNNAQTQSVARKSLYLRSGEIIGGNITQIDAEGIHFSSDMTSITRLPHDQVRAVQLLPGTGEPKIDDLNRERLLTVPRVRKKNPPTHLIVATNGDVMRCRLHKLTEKVAEVETRLETIEIDRRLISQILWLDTDTPPTSPAADAGEETLEGPRVRALLRDGNRLSMVPESVKAGELWGSSPLLSQCRVSLSDVDQLLLGTATKSADSEPYASWRLSDAPEPIDTSDADGERMAGLNSPLVGTEAPDFKLDLLDGTTFTLSSQRGKVTVLDFWATWCGPCLHAMPIVDETVKAFPAEDVTLVTINLQEAAEAIRATLKRLGIDPIVAMDIDGVAAARYQADAIPQTVVIDRSGKIVRLFVGGGENLGEQLSEAIRAALSDVAAAP